MMKNFVVAWVGLVDCSSAKTSAVDGGDSGSSAADAGTDGSSALTATSATCSAWLAQQRATDIQALDPKSASKRQEFLDAGGGLRKIDDTYYGAWFSTGHFSKDKRRVLFVLHGTDGAPEYEFADWHAALESRGWAFIGLSWVYLDKSDPDRYSNCETMTTRLHTILDEMNTACGTGTADVSLLGFSRGSAQSFEMLGRDRAGKKRLKGVIANSGAWPTKSQPTPYLVALDTAGDTTAFSGGRMWMYCGDVDDGTSKQSGLGEPMCPIMTNAKQWVEKHGGSVQKIYEDPTGGHHSLPSNATAVGEVFQFLEGL